MLKFWVVLFCVVTSVALADDTAVVRSALGKTPAIESEKAIHQKLKDSLAALRAEQSDVKGYQICFVIGEYVGTMNSLASELKTLSTYATDGNALLDSTSGMSKFCGMVDGKFDRAQAGSSDSASIIDDSVSRIEGTLASVQEKIDADQKAKTNFDEEINKGKQGVEKIKDEAQNAADKLGLPIKF